MKFEVIMAVKMSILVFWVFTPCGLADRTNVSEKNTASTFRAGGLCSSETLRSTYTTYKSTRHYNPTQKTNIECTETSRFIKGGEIFNQSSEYNFSKDSAPWNYFTHYIHQHD
jgi:hypothetical protein